MTLRFLLLLVFIDIPVFTAAVVIGHDDPLGTLEAINDWRMAHPWTLLPTLGLALWLCWRTYMRTPRDRPSAVD